MGIIVFYEGENASEHIIESVEDEPGQQFAPQDQEPIRSCKLFSVRPGCELRLYNAVNGNGENDFCIVIVKKEAPEYLVARFDRSYEDEVVRVKFLGNGSDGKISRIRIN